MLAEVKLAYQRLSILELAEALGNVSEACRQRGMTRTQFYEYKKRFQERGLEGLKDLPPIHKSHPQTTPPAVQEQVIARGKPFLGICVGMQLMATRGLEHDITPGLGWIAGDVKLITPADRTLKIPHMGWNTPDVKNPHALLDGIALGENGLHAYFVHSYQLEATLPEDVVATTDYAGPVTAMVGYDNVAGTQFHPEKSQVLGLALIANFLRWKP